MNAETIWPSKTLLEPEINELRRIANIAVPYVTDDFLGGEHTGKGVYFRAGTFLNMAFGLIYIQFMDGWFGGEKNRENEQRYYANSGEKILRLTQNTEHISSFESAIPDLAYGGANRFRVSHEMHDSTEPTIMVFSTSGLPPEGDESVNMEVALAAHRSIPSWDVYLEDLQLALDKSGNTVYKGELRSD